VGQAHCAHLALILNQWATAVGPAQVLRQQRRWKRPGAAQSTVCLFFFSGKKTDRDPYVNKIFADRSLTVKPLYLFLRDSDSGETNAYFFVSSSPSRWCHSHPVWT
jgi:hypothetical protein